RRPTYGAATSCNSRVAMTVLPSNRISLTRTCAPSRWPSAGRAGSSGGRWEGVSLGFFGRDLGGGRGSRCGTTLRSCWPSASKASAARSPAQPGRSFRMRVLLFARERLEPRVVWPLSACHSPILARLVLEIHLVQPEREAHQLGHRRRRGRTRALDLSAQ